jgi:hypothetical protein
LAKEEIWYNSRKAAIILLFLCRFSRPFGATETMAVYTMPTAPSWYNKKVKGYQKNCRKILPNKKPPVFRRQKGKKADLRISGMTLKA